MDEGHAGPRTGRRFWGRVVVLGVVLALLAWGAWRLAAPGGGERASGASGAALGARAVLSGADTAGFARAVTPRPFRFPEDHGAHLGFRSEWWYVTANLEDPEGRAFGVQLTIFRNALAPPGPHLPALDSSRWATRQAWMGHFAVTDPVGGEHRAFERFARGTLGLAGARASPFRVWVEGWSLEGGTEGTFPVRLRARDEGVAVDLVLERGKPPVPQGEEGLSRKGPEPGNASHYFSLTRMPARGTLVLDGREHGVAGLAWMDREWSTSALGPELAGWDWFALQLSDGRELTYYRLRRRDGSRSPFSGGTLVAADGRSRSLAAREVEVEVLERWRSPLDGTAYPVRWRVRVPDRELDLEVVPLMSAQEMTLTFRYWEGAVVLEGHGPSGPLSGRGYVELTGYAAEGGETVLITPEDE